MRIQIEAHLAACDALHPSVDDGVEPVKDPIEPPEFELFAQRIVANVGTVKECTGVGD